MFALIISIVTTLDISSALDHLSTEQEQNCVNEIKEDEEKMLTILHKISS